MPNILSKLDADVLAVNLFASTRGAASWDRGEHRRQRPPSAKRRAPRWARSSTPAASTWRWWTTPARPVRRRGPSRLRGPGEMGHLEDRCIALPLSATSHADRLAAELGVEVVRTKLSSSALMERPAARGRLRGHRRRRLHPAGVPAGLRRGGRHGQDAGVAGSPRRPANQGGGRPPDVHRAHETVVTLGPEGHGDGPWSSRCPRTGRSTVDG